MKKLITVKVKPSSGKREIRKESTFLTVFLTSPPEKGKANEELLEVLSEYLEIPRSRLRIKKGQASRIKLLEIDMV